MMKRILALMLACLLMLLCACTGQSNTETTAPSAETQDTAPVDVTEDTTPDYSNINELEPNEKGVYQIHSAQGLANMANHLDGKFELLCDIDLQGAAWTPVGTDAAPFTGSFEGEGFVISNLTISQGADGYTGFFGVNKGSVDSLKLVNATLEANDGFAGIFVGKNEGELTFATATGAMKLSGKAVAGGIVGLAQSGTIGFCDSSVRMEAAPECSVGLLGGQLKDVTLEKCNFSGPMNLKGDNLFTNLAGSQENVTYTECLWRDNTYSYEFLDEEAKTLRDTVEQRMREQGEVEWQVDENMSFLYPTSTLHNQYFVVGETYYGVPYTGKCSPLERFYYCFNEDGTMKDFTKRVIVGYDNFDMYMGVDCSGAVYWALAGVCPSVQFHWTQNMLQADPCGCLAVGGYEGADTLTDTKQIYDLNGEEVMAECFAQLRKGDFITTYYNDQLTGNHENHTQLLAQDPVILRDAEGKINYTASYLIIHEQGAGLTLRENSSWMIDRKQTISNLLGRYYVPLTTPELMEGKQPECVITIDNTKTGKAYMATGTVETNYRLISATIKVTDENDALVWEKTIFTPVDKFDTVRSDYSARYTVRSLNLAAFGAYLGEMELESGKTYTYELSAMPATGDSYVLKTFDFVQ